MWVLLSDLAFLGFLITLGYAMERAWLFWRERAAKRGDNSAAR
jgi:hypothetical protein